MSARTEARLWVAQRLTAAILALGVAVHLATIIYSVRGGLSAAEILARTRGSIAWAAFYGTFVIAAVVHGTIGLRTVASEWLGLRGRKTQLVLALVAGLLMVLGLRAVVAVVA